MFYYLDGTLAEREAGLAVIDCGGVGYGLTVSLTTSDALSSKVGARVKLYTYLQVKEDGMELFGFRDKDELDCFRLLIGVSGVGPKAAMAVLSIFTPDRFRLAVCTEDTKRRRENRSTDRPGTQGQNCGADSPHARHRRLNRRYCTRIRRETR